MNHEVRDLASFEDARPDNIEMLAEVRAGLLSTPKTMPSKYFYDERGSDLFQKICDLPEYYPTRAEMGLLKSMAGEIAELIGPGCQMIEYGCGSSEKMRIVLSALIEPESFTAVDISKEHLLVVTKALSLEYPDLMVHAVSADFIRPFAVPAMVGTGLRVGFFPGSTIGNFTHEGAIEFLTGTKEVVGPNGAMLIGVDLKKDERILHAAYNDSQGVTAAFNLNLLARLNRELGATFDLCRFRHDAFYNAERSRIEMHLVSLSEQTVTLGGEVISFQKDETIHTENSYKYRPDEFVHLARMAGWRLEQRWLANDDMFSVFLLHADR